MTIRLAIPMLLLASATSAGEVVQAIALQDVAHVESLPSGCAVTLSPSAGADGGAVDIDCSEGPATVLVAELGSPPITSKRYAVTGQVRHTSVAAGSYLEMWSTFETGRFFSRTLAPNGPFRKLDGTSEWRDFSLPFYANSGMRPSELTVNAVLAGAGRVELRSLRLMQYGWNEDPFAATGSDWWGPRTAGLIGGTAGTCLGVFGGLLGWLASRGRARRFVLASMTGVIVVGAITLIAGIAAVASSQPYAVYYPLLLIGVLSIVIPATRLRRLRDRYEELELRRMRAVDVR